MKPSVLDAREERYQKILALAVNGPVLCIVPIMPGPKKNTLESKITLHRFVTLINDRQFIQNPVLYASADGPYMVCNLVDQDVIKIKKHLISIEESHPLGRLIDLDVFVDGQFISRRDVNHPLRKCMMCHENAHVCTRNRTHDLTSVIHKTQDMFKQGILDELEDIIGTSMKAELDLHPKFGLVTPYTKGSHSDMSYDIMAHAQDAIKPFLAKMFLQALYAENDEDAFVQARRIGLEAEFAMYQATQGINAYKGLIFVLGFILIGCARALVHDQKPMVTFELIRTMAAPLRNELTAMHDTFGLRAYKEVNIGGARMEALLGFPSIQATLKNPSNTPVPYLGLLIDLIRHSEDTTLLKRAKSIDRYNEVKQRFVQLNPFDTEALEALNASCIAQNLSFGGAADLLVATVAFNHIRKNYFLDEIKKTRRISNV